MFKYLITFIIFFNFGCKINSQQIIKPENFKFNEIRFNAVSKELTFNDFESDLKIENMKKIINYWYDNKIKVDGFEGSLNVIIKDINLNEIKEENYYKFYIDLIVHFNIQHNNLQRIKSYEIKASDFGEISGSFSIKDQENLSLNIMHKSLESINNKILDIN